MPPASKNKNKNWQNRGRHALGRTQIVTAVTPGARRLASPAFDKKSNQPVSPVRFDLSDEAEAKALLQHQQEQANQPQNVCVRQHVPSHATFALTQISSLLQYVAPGSIVAFDIDDTLIKKRHFACSLLTTEGSRQFHLYIQQHLKNHSYSDKQNLVNALHREVKAFELAENETAAVVKALQSRGVYVFGLTARASTMAAATNMSLSALDMDLAVCPPPTLPVRAVEPHTGATIVDGIVYCNEVDKGVVFQRLLNLNWLSWPSKHACHSKCASTCTVMDANSVSRPTHHHSEDGKGCPDRTVWFVDDNLPMISGMLSQWTNMAQTLTQVYAQLGPWSSQMPCRGKMALVCCHYTHPTAAATPQVPATRIAECVQKQIEHFVQTGAIISDMQALQMIDGNQHIQQATQLMTPSTPVH